MRSNIHHIQPTYLFILTLTFMSCGVSHSKPEGEETRTVMVESPEKSSQKIMLALILDTSNSMDGLIEQAKSQLWSIVNELSEAKCDDGARPSLEIALFEYGNDDLPSSEGYIRMVSNLTNDLDEISSELFKLNTNGGDEYCGQVINKSIHKLDWSNSKADLKMIFIAGNEAFNQGRYSYKVACNLANEKGIIVNTIFCGAFQEGVNTFWKSGADLTGGSYMSIEQDRKTVYIKTPHDDEIDRLNAELNKTYIHYGNQGKNKKEMQLVEDENAGSYSQANRVKRAISKSSHVYKNSSWDLVDASKENESVVMDVEEKYLPQEMQGMSDSQRKEYVYEQSAKREKLQEEIQRLSMKRKQYIVENQSTEEAKNTLDQVMISAIKEAAKTKQLIFN